MKRKVLVRGHLSASDSRSIYIIFSYEFKRCGRQDSQIAYPSKCKENELLSRVSNGICDQYAHGSDFTHLVESSS